MLLEDRKVKAATTKVHIRYNRRTIPIYTQEVLSAPMKEK